MNKKNYWSKKYDPESKDPFVISRSKIEMYLKCKRCFFLDRKLSVKPPETLPFTLNSAVDALLKNDFDQARKSKTQHRYLKQFKINAIPFDHNNLETWRSNFKGIRYHHKKTNFIVTGAIDDVWMNQENNKLHMVDYKSSSTKDVDKIKYLGQPWHDGWKRQLDIYGFLFKNNGFDVHETGYFLFCNAQKNLKEFDNKLNFELTMIPYELNLSWIDKTLLEIKEFLDTKDMPDYGINCDNCRFLKENNTLKKD